MHKKTSVGVTICMILLQVSPAFAERAIILSDYELDQVYAGGLNFNFDNGFLGSTSTAADNISKGSLADARTVNTNAFVVNPNNPNVTIKAPVVPSAPTAPMLPTVPSSVLPALDQSNVIPDLPTGQAILDQSVVMEQSLLGTLPEAPSLQSSVGSAPAETAAIPQSFFVSEPAVPAIPSIPSTSSTPSAPSLPLTPSSPFSVVNPHVPMAPKMPTVDVIATTGGKFSVSVDANSGINPVPFTASNGYNYLNVSETAQQNLSAVVNVNAAGSVVPVQVNLTVLMNSNVENISNFNDLKLNHYTTYQVQ
jgi:hypothetical protein